MAAGRIHLGIPPTDNIGRTFSQFYRSAGKGKGSLDYMTSFMIYGTFFDWIFNNPYPLLCFPTVTGSCSEDVEVVIVDTLLPIPETTEVLKCFTA